MNIAHGSCPRVFYRSPASSPPKPFRFAFLRILNGAWLWAALSIGAAPATVAVYPLPALYPASTNYVLAVNGTNQPVFRDVPTTIKRKYVEVLARMKETKYRQVRNPIELDRSELVPRTGPIYPFEVIRDDNPKGRAWLRSIIAEVE